MCVENSSDDAELTSELNKLSWDGLKNAAVNHIVVKVNWSIFGPETCRGTRQATLWVINCCPSTVNSKNVLSKQCSVIQNVLNT